MIHAGADTSSPENRRCHRRFIQRIEQTNPNQQEESKMKQTWILMASAMMMLGCGQKSSATDEMAGGSGSKMEPAAVPVAVQPAAAPVVTYEGSGTKVEATPVAIVPEATPEGSAMKVEGSGTKSEGSGTK
jgi:hypothetical protein